MKAFPILSYSILCINLLLTSASDSSFKLELVQVLFRHGDKTPSQIERYETDPHDPVGYRDYGYGQLTVYGKRRAHKLGQMLRQRYNNFLGDYNVRDVYAYSTDFDRTKMSLQLVLSGLYPPTETTRWSKLINWTPIPIHFQPTKTDFIFLNVTPACYDKYAKLFMQFEKSPAITEVYEKYRSVIEYIKNKAKLPSTSVFSLYMLAFNIECVLNLNLPLPHWYTKAVEEVLEKFPTLFYELTTYTGFMRRLASGPFIERLLENINNNDQSKNKKKVYLYSGHDINVATFVRTHKFTDVPAAATYGSAVIVEKLRGPDDRVYLRMLYWSAATEELIVLKLENCSYVCLLSDYVNIVSPNLPRRNENECEL